MIKILVIFLLQDRSRVGQKLFLNEANDSYLFFSFLENVLRSKVA